MVEIIFLGTGSMVPTKKRGHSSVLLNIGMENMLFDCGEGTQRQIQISGENFMKISKIFITHWHMDHFIGLFPLIDTMKREQRKDELTIYAPKANQKFIEDFFNQYTELPWLKFQEVSAPECKIIAETDTYRIYAADVQHGIKCVAYRYEEKRKKKVMEDELTKLKVPRGKLWGMLQRGKDVDWNGKILKAEEFSWIPQGSRITYAVDTLPCKNVEDIAKGADLLICESTFLSDLKKEADERFHMTAEDAAKIAKIAGVRKLILTHFSRRYTDEKPFLDEAEKIFPRTKLSEDFMQVTV